MMRRVFADTSYWIALLNRRDELHEKAREVSLSNLFDEIVTSQMALAELLNSFSERGANLRQAVAKAVEALGSSRFGYCPFFPERKLLAEIWDPMRHFRDEKTGGWSFWWGQVCCSAFGSVVGYTIPSECRETGQMEFWVRTGIGPRGAWL